MRKQILRLIRDILIIEIGLMVSSFGTALFYAADLGSGAMATFSDGLHRVAGISYGQANMAANVVLLFVLLVLDRKYINVGTLLCVFTIGLWVDLFNGVLSDVDAARLNMAVRVLMSVAGSALMGFGLGIYVAIGRGLGALEGLVKVVCGRTRVSMRAAKIVQDALLVVLGVVMGAAWGVGTLIAIVMTGPVLQESCRRFEALFARLFPKPAAA